MRDELKALFPEHVRGVELLELSKEEPLFPEELALMARAVEKRRREFAAGRTCARRALAALGIPAQPLLSNDDRSVRWPAEAWGSITHTEGLCAAVAARREHLAGLGIDAEVRGRVHEKLWSHIANQREIRWIDAARDEAEARERATLLFSAKEAFYKAQYCVTRTFVGFHEVELVFDASGEFTVQLQNDIANNLAQGSLFRGRYTVLEEHVVTGLVIDSALASARFGDGA